MFFTLWNETEILNFQPHLLLSSANAFNLDQSEILSPDERVNSLPNDTFINWSKLKAFADDKLNLAEKLKFVLKGIENIEGKGENAGYQHFLVFPQCFQMVFFSGSLKVGIVW